MPEVLQTGWSTDERGHTWLFGESDHYILLNLGGNRRLEITTTVDNYPGLKVSVLEASDAQCAAHIQKTFAGWWVRKCNIPGVEIKHDQVALVEYLVRNAQTGAVVKYGFTGPEEASAWIREAVARGELLPSIFDYAIERLDEDSV